MVVGKGQVFHRAGIKLAHWNLVPNPLTGLGSIGVKLIDAPVFAAVELEGAIGANLIISIKTNAVDFARLGAFELKLQNCLGRDIVGKINLFPTISPDR
ncbi:MAG: hypothetical protein HC771_18545 [Synechococcales cyanobacterium CRU_2_2]|nr:hypothetical protein [Synechococcales cyanobacterium CRU_2_2]